MRSGEEEVLQLFVEESREHLETIEEDFLAIEQAGENYSQELVNKTFRAIHTIKGGASLFSFRSISSLSHEMENVLGKIREKELFPIPEIISVLLDSADTLKSMINNLDQADNKDVSSFISRLKSFQCENVKKDTVPDMQDISGIPVLDESGEQIALLDNKKVYEMQNRDQGGRFIYLIKIDLSKELQEQNKTIDDLLSVCREFSNIIDFFDFAENKNCYYIICTTFMEKQMLQEMLGLPEEIISLVLSGKIKPTEETTSCNPDLESRETGIQDSIEPEIVENKINNENKKPQNFQSNHNTSLRVNISILDRLMTLAGELVLTRNHLVQNADTGNSSELKAVTQRVDSITSELQEAIMSTRMQSIGLIFNKFKRLVRDIAGSIGKKVELRIEGEDVELDKSIIEIIGDPLTHIVRNSIDHGIESPVVREKAGKPQSGLLKLKAAHEAGLVIIEIEDDGAGIDPDKVGQKAVSMGLVDENRLSKMSDRDIIKLIFRPGFSTADKITDISGRGVGMDVVQNNLSKVGGAIDIDSSIGKGTSIRIKLPLTLAIIPSLLVSVEKENFAIPQVNLVELVRLAPGSVREKIEKVGNATVMRLRNELLPLVRVSDLLDIPRSFIDPQTGRQKPDRRNNIADRRCDTKDSSEPFSEKRKRKERRKSCLSAVNIAVVAAGNFKYGLIVDKLLDSVEIVVKPLGYHLCSCREYAGATILGDGKVALILDVIGIREMLNMKEIQTAVESSSDNLDSEISDLNDSQSLLIVENSKNDFFAVPLGIISRIEKMPVSSISVNGGRLAIPYRKGSLPLFCIEDIIKVQPRPENKSVYIMIFQAGGREVGIMTNEIMDTIEYNGIIDDKTHAQPGILGSILVHNKIVLMLDLYTIVHMGAPDLFDKSELSNTADTEKNLILVVEDSSFFLKQIKAFIEDAGYDVLTAEDGIKGLAVLNNSVKPVDLVLTDIEMPNMNGLELTKKIRKDEKLKHIPVIAVTSVIGDKAEKLGQEAGIDKYLVKLDREKVLDACRYFITNGRSKNKENI